jgi:BirA family biotin operon repressor/biotin-[acetyl-CoA-carboxylase] ligase
VTDQHQGLTCLLLGIGLNLNLALHQIPEDLRDKATSARIATGRHCDRLAVAAALFARLDCRYTEFQEHGFEAIGREYQRYFALAGRQVTIVDRSTRLSGVAVGIDQTGALMLQTPSGSARVIAGEVSVEGAYG